MFTLSKIGFRRLLAICLISTMLFFSSAIAIPHHDVAVAEVLKRDATGISENEPLNDVEYESAKASRSRQQAELSKQASAEAEAKAESESVAEKLNLDEITPPGIDN